jgi:hypothetical protein
VPDDYEDIDLNALSDDELVEQMHNDLYDGMRTRSSRGRRSCSGAASPRRRSSTTRSSPA